MIRTVVALFLLAAAAPAAADDAQLWVQGVVTGPIHGNIVTWIEVQPRLTDDASRLGQLFVRPAIGVQLKGAQLLAGYMYGRFDPEGGSVRHEHRLWQQALVPILGKPGQTQLLSRTRLEQRMFEDSADTGLRLRQWLRLQTPIGPGWQAIATTEAFFNLNDTDAGQVAGFDQWRNFVGVGRRLTPRLTLEGGYLNQWINGRARDPVNHAISLTLLYRIG